MNDVVVALLDGGWPLVGFALVLLALGMVVFGVMPGVLNRLFASMYPKDDPRRAEMIAELYAVPRWEQPIWVAQQGERAFFEGIKLRWDGGADLRRMRKLTRPVRRRLVSLRNKYLYLVGRGVDHPVFNELSLRESNTDRVNPQDPRVAGPDNERILFVGEDRHRRTIVLLVPLTTPDLDAPVMVEVTVPAAQGELDA